MPPAGMHGLSSNGRHRTESLVPAGSCVAACPIRLLPMKHQGQIASEMISTRMSARGSTACGSFTAVPGSALQSSASRTVSTRTSDLTLAEVLDADPVDQLQLGTVVVLVLFLVLEDLGEQVAADIVLGRPGDADGFAVVR